MLMNTSDQNKIDRILRLYIIKLTLTIYCMDLISLVEDKLRTPCYINRDTYNTMLGFQSLVIDALNPD